MPTLFKILIGLLVAVGLFFIYVGTRPAEMKVSREMVMNASAEAIFPFINQTKKADEWMPWLASDPKVQMTYSGPEAGVGSTSSWTSEGKMGTGSAAIVESIPNQLVKTQLTYTKPFQMSQLAMISLSPATPTGTTVTWSVEGKSTFLCKLVGVFVNMDKMIGGEFEKGLTKLKGIVEKK